MNKLELNDRLEDSEILKLSSNYQTKEIKSLEDNLLINADNLLGLKWLIDHGYSNKIDLVYIDPPFATNNKFTISNDRSSTISRSKKGELAYSDKFEKGEYLEFIRRRLVLLSKLLSDKGSIYLHIDLKIGHYVKVIMDEIFGVENFRNDITRIKCNPKNFSRKGFGNVKDMILFYSKSKNPVWHEAYEQYSEADIKRLFKKIDSKGRRYTTVPIHAPGETQDGESSKEFKGMKPPEGRHWRTNVPTLEKWDKEGLIEWSKNGVPRKIIYSDEREGKKMQDIWEFKDPQNPKYPTEKNIDMLEHIIKTSSNENSIVLDCFAGSGTTMVAASKLGRKWIGIDSSSVSIKVIKKRFKNEEKELFKNNSFSVIDIKAKKSAL